MKKKETYFLISGGGMFRDEMMIVLSKLEVEKALNDIVQQLNIISKYLKANKIKNLNKIPSKDKKNLFKFGISENLYLSSRFPIQYSFSVSKWNGNYFTDVTKKFNKTILGLPKIKEYQIIKVINLS